MKIYQTLSVAYPEIIRDVLENGKECAPRGQKISEICGYSFKLMSIEDSLPLQKSRKLNYKFGILEGLLNIAGVYPPEIVLKFNKNLESYINPNTGTWDGAYAPRIDAAIIAVRDLLIKDPDTRQAILPIYKISDIQGAQTSKDVPCTISLQFLLRDGKLNTIATMRSNDVLWGLAYDVNQFVMITRALCADLEVEPGWYVHQAGSMHAYTERIEQLMEVVNHPLPLASFKHPVWPKIKLETTRNHIKSMLYKIENGSNKSGVPEPFNTYFEYLIGEKKVEFPE